jgi:hypothetical protein
MSLGAEDLEAVDRITEEIAVLIEPEAAFRAEFARDFAKAIRTEPSRTRELYVSHAWWGGPGSMADFYFGDRRKDAAFTRLLAQLVRVFQRAGVRYERAEGWAEIFEAWARDGVYE